MISRCKKIFTYYRLCKVSSLFLFGVFSVSHSFSASYKKPGIYYTDSTRWVYTYDDQGNRILDFSYCGYKASEIKIPIVPAKVTVTADNGDATGKIQKAIDYISSLKPDSSGFKGAVLLGKGTFKLNGRLFIRSSGIVLRGSGMNDETVLIAAGKDRETLIQVIGGNVDKISDVAHKIIQNYVPVNSLNMVVENASLFSKGQSVFIRRPSVQSWIDLLQMKLFGSETQWLGWNPGDHDLVWDREIKAIHGDTLFFDAPVTTSIDENYGGGTISAYQWPSRIVQVGIENLSIVSECIPYNKKDEDHCWMGITFENVRDSWVRQVSFRHLAGSAVAAYENTSRITVENCASYEPVSEIGGMRRNTFFTAGQQTLFRNIFAEFGYHDFGTGFCAAGPNAFVFCGSHLPFSFSGGIDSWASGTLFDMVSVDGNALSFRNREQDGFGAGWTAANSVLWQCSASRIECYSPPGAANYVFGTWVQFAGNGVWTGTNEQTKSLSLFYSQLSERIGNKNFRLTMGFDTTRAANKLPNERLTGLANIPKNSVATSSEWIKQIINQNPIFGEKGTIPNINQMPLNVQVTKSKKREPLSIINGWLSYGRKLSIGNCFFEQPNRNNLRPSGVTRALPAITRNVPGQHGLGYTDNLDDVADWMYRNNYVSIEHANSFAYDRRSNDRELIRRIDGDTWPPFYEQPFARSGDGIAWDGLSKYDLTKYNTWYWSRLKQFADLADQRELILIHNNYYRGSVRDFEIYWADSPWRTTNNINNTGISENNESVKNVNRIFDLSNLVLTDLHQKYIRQCLNNFKENNSVIQTAGFESSAPLQFVRFWTDVIREWENETGKTPIIALSAVKNIRDSILADPVRSKVIDLIDIRSSENGSEHKSGFARQDNSVDNSAKASNVETADSLFEQVYNEVLTYRIKYPGKAVCYSINGKDSYGWPVFMAGGSLAALPRIQVNGFVEGALEMVPVISPGKFILRDKKGQCIIYFPGNTEMDIDLRSAKATLKLIQLNPKDGTLVKSPKTLHGGKIIKLGTALEDTVVWVTEI